MKEISSRNNPQVKLLIRLARSTRTRHEHRMLVLDGVHLVQAYLDLFGPEGVELFIKRSAAGHDELARLAHQASASLVDDALFDLAAPVDTPVGVLALAQIPAVRARSSELGFQVVLDGIQDPGNLGAILRAAAAAGAELVQASSLCSDHWSPRALRGGMGAQFVLPVERHDDLTRALDGRRLVACTVDTERSIFDADLRGRLAFVIGSEGGGVSDALLQRADERLAIPMTAGVESLNAAVAAGICFYEWYRQNLNPKAGRETFRG